MEELIPFLLFVIFGILSAVGKVRKDKKKRKGASARGRKGLAARIHAWLTDLQQRIEAQSKNAPKGTFDWGQLIGRSDLKGPEAPPPDEVFDDVDSDTAQESPPPEATPVAASPPPPRIPTPSPEISDGMAVDIPRMVMKTRRKPIPGVLPTNRADLRRAIVWSEIIGPPIALRDPFGDNR